MIYELRMPSLVTEGAKLRIETIDVRAGDSIARGARLFDFSLDLTPYADLCPPITYHRVVAQEGGLLRAVMAEPGAVFDVNAVLGLLSSDPAEPIDVPPSRAFRVVLAGISWHERMWSAGLRI